MSTLVRCSAVGTAATACLVAAVHGLAGDLFAPATDLATALTRLCTAALLLALVWGWVTVMAGVVEAWRRARPGCSSEAQGAHGVRRIVLVACGVAVTGALAAPAVQAAPAPQVGPVSSSAAATPRTPNAPHLHRDVRVVRRGDSLWSIAASQVQPGAGPATITARWRAVYAANYGVIGSDPDLIHPGQRLRMPR